MGSRQCRELSLGDGRSGSSRKGKKSHKEKPKQPQRGLGVAQLEKIRLHNQMMGGHINPSLHPPFHSTVNKKDERENLVFPSSSSLTSTTAASPFGLHPNTMMGFGDTERRGVKYDEFQHSVTERSSSSHDKLLFPNQFPEPPLTLPLFDQTMEKKRRDDCCHSMGSSSQNTDSSNSQELDLDLKLSL